MTKGEVYQNFDLFFGLTKKNGYKAGKLYSYKPSDGTGDFQWTRTSAANRINQSGATESMGINVPRVDYTNTCPELLMQNGGSWVDYAWNDTMDYSAGMGTLFIRVRVTSSVSAKTDVIASLNDGSADNYIVLYTDKDNNLTISTYEALGGQNDYTYALGANGIYNIAVGYDLSAYAINIAVNGILKRANAGTTNELPTIVNRFDLGSIAENLFQVDNRIIGGGWKSTQLTDADLIAITG